MTEHNPDSDRTMELVKTAISETLDDHLMDFNLGSPKDREEIKGDSGTIL